MQLSFLGAAGTVTGSKYLVTFNGFRLLVDCGLYQGLKDYRRRNWQPLPVPTEDIDAIVLTHAHIDHSGYLPALVRQGYDGPVYCSQGTRDLCRVLLPDAGYLQEEDARFANKHGFSRHQPALPLYTEEDARRALKLFSPLPLDSINDIGNGLTLRLRPAGHILGACTLEVFNGRHLLCFSGDLGRADDPIMYPPDPMPRADYLVLESTYGDRLHAETDSLATLEQIINKTAKRGGIVLMPAFAVGRAQLALHMISQLKLQNRIPRELPIYLNSPMAIKATELFYQHPEKHRLTREDCERIDTGTLYVRTMEESMALNRRTFPAIIISASGMASGGRVLHHLTTLAPNHRNSIVFMGFQTPGTRGEKMVNGAREVKIHGRQVAINADVHNLEGLSAHADYQGILDWLTEVHQPPKKVFVTHGEPTASDALANHIQTRFGWSAGVPELGTTIEIPDPD
ncbi:MAG: MBL fold metallo-hydrolase [Oceanospirillales bacterium LUC14_002_19_P2]|nr:MAG: MBL fold metallo-hydrolase [Oceanospirillales bacterium LUC14_002_19_P2]